MADGVLYVVATPIGNLEDLSPRAVRILGEVDLVAAEDTRRTRILLARHGVRRPMASYHDAVERARTPRLLARLRDGARVALVTDAGTPGISDPGYHLVRSAAQAGIAVVPVPGPSALTALLSVAGIACERFVFEGFVPTKQGPRRRAIERLRDEPRAIVLLESGRRLGALLGLLGEILGDREVVVGRELTKRHEEIMRGTLVTVAHTVAARGGVRGEVTLVVAGAPAPLREAPTTLDEEIGALLADGFGVKEVARRLASTRRVSRRAVYARALELAGKR